VPSIDRLNGSQGSNGPVIGEGGEGRGGEGGGGGRGGDRGGGGGGGGVDSHSVRGRLEGGGGEKCECDWSPYLFL
jgi:hypothetical protein